MLFLATPALAEGSRDAELEKLKNETENLEKAAQEAGFDVTTGSVSGPNRYPSGMPGMINMSVKLVFSKQNGTIIGGHICGGSSVGESVNIIGAAIRKRMTAPDIVRLLL